MITMETAFDLLDENARSNFLRVLMQSFDCTYVCFWACNVHNSTNVLKCQDGMYCEEFHSQLPSSSSGSFALRLFYEYKKSIFNIHAEKDHIPGLAFRNNFQYWEFQESELQTLASNETQRQFYQEARIKTTIFIGCKYGEIEIGLSNVPTIKARNEIRGLFLLEDLKATSITQPQQVAHHEQLSSPILTDPQNPHYSSSSSSLRSLSNIDSPEYSSLLFNMNNVGTSTSQLVPEISSSPSSSPLLLASPHQEVIQALARLRNPQFPSPEAEELTMTQTILAVLTSSLPLPPPFSSPSSSYIDQARINTKSSAFTNYNENIFANLLPPDRNLGSKKSMFKQSIRFFRRLNQHMRSNRQTLQIPRPNSTQMHHMMSERKRREKLNDSFLALRSLLPPGTKKDKASLLNATKEYLSSLKSQIENLSQRNKQLEAQVLSNTLEANYDGERESIGPNDSSNDHIRGIDVQVTRHMSESGTEDHHHHQVSSQIVDLRVILRADNNNTTNNILSIDDLVLRVLQFLKRCHNISLVSLQADADDSLARSTTPIHRLTLRLRVEGTDWDESAFKEAVRRVVADLAQ